MNRSDFIKIIKLRSFWKIDKRRGNYTLPSGERLSHYIDGLVRGQLMLDMVAPASNGELAMCADIDPSNATELDEAKLPIYHLMIPFGENETCNFDTMQIRIKSLVNAVIHG
jgi:hypothetical protein